MNEKQKKSLKKLKIIEFVIFLIACVVIAGDVRYDFFNGEPVNYAAWCFAFLIWIVVWLSEYRKLNFPEE